MDSLKRWSRKLKGSGEDYTNRPINPAYSFPAIPHPSESSHDNDTKGYGGPHKAPLPHTYGAPASHGGSGSSSNAPPPSYSTYNDDYKPPAFPPPSEDEDDLPPPPTISHNISPAFNSTRDLADAGYRFCSLNALFPPRQFAHGALAAVPAYPGPLALAPPPPYFRGRVSGVNGGMLVEANGCEDACLVSELPLFAAGYHHPANTGRGRVFGYEVMVLALPRDAAVLAMGFAGMPYPAFRLPGWNRGSFGVHSDDGRRYCNDSFGGMDFTRPFRAGERIGICMRFPVALGGRGIEVFFTRDGKQAGGWRLYEETDSESRLNPAEGLDGSADIYAAIGVYGSGLRVVVDNFYSREE